MIQSERSNGLSTFGVRFAALISFILSVNLALAAEPIKTGDSSSSNKSSIFMGPGFHLGLGIRMKKAPDLDTYYSVVGGLKVSLFSIQAGEQSYISFLAPGLQYEKNGVFVLSVTPIMFNHNIGVGVGLDFYSVRADRRGGPVGMSINFDVMKMISSVGSFGK